MGINFPNSPTVGQQWPVPPVAGIPVYQWDGEKWTAGPPAIPDGLVHYDISQSLTTAQLVQARKNIVASPFEAMMYNGIQINGGFEVSQEIGSVGTNVGGKYFCDGWMYHAAGSSVNGAVGQAAAGAFFPGYEKCAYVSTITAQASMGAGDYVVIQQPIEGFRVNRLRWGTAAAQPLSIGFWTAHSKPGIYSVTVTDYTGTRAYSTTYTQAVANTAQYNVITIPGCTDGASWNKDQTCGMRIDFVLACGTTYTVPVANAWQNGNYLSAPGQVNGVDNTSNLFRITGVILLPGIELPSSVRAPFIIRSYDQEIQACRRYLQRVANNAEDLMAVGQCYGTSNTIMLIALASAFRAAPVLTYSLLTDFVVSNAGFAPQQPSSISLSATTSSMWQTLGVNTVATGLVAGNAAMLRRNTVNAWLQFDARI